MRTAAIAGLVGALPLFALLNAFPTIFILTVIQALLGVVMAFYFAPLPALMSAMFPTNVRTTGMSLAYNIGVTLFGGMAPIVLAVLVEQTGSLVSPGYYYMFVAIVSMISLALARKRYGQR